MSKILYPDTESSVTCGFFDSLDGDRLYNAKQFTSIFDGIINDGVFASLGDCFAVTVSSIANSVTIGSGRAWFNHTWVHNDVPFRYDLSAPDVLLDRYDVICLCVDYSTDKRDVYFTVIEGTAASNPVKPSINGLTHDSTTGETIEIVSDLKGSRTSISAEEYTVNYHPIAYIYRKANTTSITTANIENVVGTSETPLVTGILEVTSIDAIISQWRAELDDFETTTKAETTKFINDRIDDVNKLITDKTAELNELISDANTEVDELISSKTTELVTFISNSNTEFNEWFENLKTQLDGDVATNLQNQIDEITGITDDEIDEIFNSI